MMDTQSHRRGVVLLVQKPAVGDAAEWAAQEANARRVPLTIVGKHAAVAAGVIDKQTVKSGDTTIIGERHDYSFDELAELATTSEMMVMQHIPGCERLVADLLDQARCPILVVYDNLPRGDGRPVLVGVGGSSSDEAAIDTAFDQAARRHVTVIAVHTWTEPGKLGLRSPKWAPIEWANYRREEEELLAERLAGRRDRYPDVAVERVVSCEEAAPELRKHARDAQLAVIGHHSGHERIHRRLGPVTYALLGSQCPAVLITPGISSTS